MNSSRAGYFLGACVFLAQAASAVQPSISIQLATNAQVRLQWATNAQGVVVQETDSLSPPIHWQPVTQTPLLLSNVFSIGLDVTNAVRFFRIQQSATPQTFQVTAHTPLDGAVDVGSTFRPQVFFSEAVDPTTLSGTNFFASFAGQKLDARIVPANDGSFAWLFLSAPMPGGAEIQITIDGSAIRAAGGGPALDAAGHGTPGSALQFNFTTVSLAPLAGTALAGIVVDPGPDLIPGTPDDVIINPDGSKTYLLPIAGVQVSLLGEQNQSVTTGTNGLFFFPAVPSGDVKVVFEGLTASNPPSGYYFPEMVIDAQMALGITNSAMQDSSAVYLPRLATNILQTVSATSTNLLTATAAGAPNLSAFQRSQLTLTVAPNSLIGPNGQPLSSGQIGISTVPSQLVMDMLPPGVLQHTFDITIQAPGIATFSTPASLTFPNVFNAAPGTKLDFLSFDHTTGRLVIEGTATVSADGATVRTDPGTGVTHPGWHGLTPPGGPSGPPCPPSPPPSQFVLGNALSSGVTNGLFWADTNAFVLSFMNIASPLDPGSPANSPQNCQATPIQVQLAVDDTAIAEQFLTGLFPQTALLQPGQNVSIPVKMKPLAADSSLARDRMYGVKVTVTVSQEDNSGNFTPIDFQDLDTGNTLHSPTSIYIYRYVDASDADPSDGILDFADTLASSSRSIERKRSVEYHLPSADMPILHLLSADAFSDSELPNNLIFNPGSVAANLTTLLNVNTPEGVFIDTLQLRGTGTPTNNIWINKAGLVQLLTQFSTAALPLSPFYFTGSELALIDTDAKRQDLANEVESAIFDRFAAVNAGIALTTTPDVNTISINWAAAVPTEPDLYGYAGAIVDDEVAINTAVLNYNSRPANAQNFILSKAINQSFTGLVTVYLESIIQEKYTIPNDLSHDQLINLIAIVAAHEFAHTLGAVHVAQLGNVKLGPNAVQLLTIQGLALNETFQLYYDGQATGLLPVGASAMDIQNALSALPNIQNNVSVTAAAAPGTFNIQFIGDFRAVDVQPLTGALSGLGSITISTTTEGSSRDSIIAEIDRPTAFGRNDIMCGGFLDLGGNGTFQAGLSLDLLYLGLKLDWTSAQAQNARALYLDNLAKGSALGQKGGFDGRNGDPDVLPGLPGPHLSVFETNSILAPPVIDFGSVLVDGPGNDQGIIALNLLNFGTNDLTLTSVQLSSMTGNFTISAIAPGTVVPPGQSQPLEIIFDPLMAGAATATLQIQSDDPNGPSQFQLTGFGLSPSASILVIAPNNNAGGAPIGGQAVTLVNFATITNQGSQPLIIKNIQTATGSGQGEFAVSGLPNGFAPANPIALPPGQAFVFGLSFSPSKIGLRRGDIQISSNDTNTPVYDLHVDGTGLAASGNPLDSLDYGNDYVALEIPDISNFPVLRQRSDAQGNWSFFLPPELRYHAVIFDPVSGLVAHFYGVTAPSGSKTQMGLPVFRASTSRDTVGDGLPDDVKFAIGLPLTTATTTVDGISTFAAIEMGLDPLAGQSFPQGIIASVPLPGNAREIAIVASTQANGAQLAYVALGRSGLAIIDVSKFNQPTLLSTLALPGDAGDVGVDPDSQIAAVAANSGGLHLVDVSNPAVPRLIQTFSMNASQVKVANGVAYVCQDSGIQAIDLVPGISVQTLQVPGAPLVSMAREGNLLVTLNNLGNGLEIVDVGQPSMVLRGSLSLQAKAVKVFVGNSVAYFTLGLTGGASSGGYLSVDVSNPQQPRMRTAQVQNLRVAGQAFAANGSGLGILVGQEILGGSAFENILDVVSLGPTNQPYSFVTRFNLPAPPQSVVIASGIAFVADGTAGMQVVNYLSFDSKGQPPVVSVDASSLDTNTNLPGIQVMAGSMVSLPVTVRDDVQVRSVELLVNGQVVQTMLSFPFNLGFIVPAFKTPGTQVMVQVRATDTGGNVTISDPLSLEVLPDTTAPMIVAINPPDGSLQFNDLNTIEVVFSKAMDPATINLVNLGVFDDQNRGIVLPGIGLQDAQQKAELALPQLSAGVYQLVIKAAAVKDLSGNPLGTNNFVSSFRIGLLGKYDYTLRWAGRPDVDWRNPALPPLQGSWSDTNNWREWKGKPGDDWNDPKNWGPGHVPGSNDNVYIDPVAGAIFFNNTNPGVARVQSTVSNLTSQAHLYLFYVTLEVRETLLVNTNLEIVASVLRGGTLVGTPNGNVLLNAGYEISGGGNQREIECLWDGLTLAGNVTLSPQSPAVRITITNSLTVNGTAQGLYLDCFDPVQLNGSGQLVNCVFDVFGAPTIGNPGPGSGALTIGTNLTVRSGEQAFLDSSDGGVIVNAGRLIVDPPVPTSTSQTTDIDLGFNFAFATNNPGQLINYGMIEVRTGALLRVVSNPPTNDLTHQFRHFINNNAFVVDSGAHAHIMPGTLWSSASTTVARGAGLLMEGTLLTDPGQTSIFSGAGDWLANAEVGCFNCPNPHPSVTAFRGGTLTLTNGAVLNGAAILDNLTLNGNLQILAPTDFTAYQSPNFLSRFVYLKNNLTLNGTMTLGDPDGTNYGLLICEGAPQPFGTNFELVTTISGNANILFGANSNNSVLFNFPNVIGEVGSQLELGSNVVVHGKNFKIANNPSVAEHYFFLFLEFNDLLNLGTIAADGPGGTVGIKALPQFPTGPAGWLTNAGTLSAQDGATLSITTPECSNLGDISLGSNSTAKVTGNYLQSASGNLFVALGGPAVGAFSQLNVTGAASLAGALNIALTNGYTPALGDIFNLVDWTSYTGTFVPINGTNLPGGLVLKPNYQPAGLSFTTSPP